MKPVARAVLCGLLLLAVPTVALAEAGTGSSVLTGTVIDSESRLPVAEVVVVATSPALPDERTAVTDARGNYLIPRLPPGGYTLRFERELYVSHVRADIQLREKRTLRVTAELVLEARREEAAYLGLQPITDVGATSTSVTVDEEFLRRIAMARPSLEEDAPCTPCESSFVCAWCEAGGAPRRSLQGEPGF
ncbi:carboxypeptidase-like regulatory domain-containing protein [Pyxidicoccus trucidator]|uniref:carboxypeptidase-like regulatory domain-containing protein n=1 Tax=Pyxidicoccus trucidator TaxID=2709662 RepID=UPI0013DD1D57|nr:carboxypeptidase-like regulatory domain-containing protein [Pyxidicoccus trucidator]